MLYRWRLALFALLLAGCGSSLQDYYVVSPQPTPGASVSTFVAAATGGAVQHPTGHSANLTPNSLSDDGLVSMILVDSKTLSVPNSRDFRPVGQAVRLDFEPGVTMVGQTSFELPYATDQPERFGVYWHLDDGLVLPLPHDYADGVFRANLDLTPQELSLQQGMIQAQASPGASSVTVSVVDESGWFSRPAHVPWPSYNLYVFRNGKFERIVDQGTPLEAIPQPGSSPLMVVHGLGSSIPTFDNTAAYLQAQGGFTQIYGFEYDTLSSLSSSGAKLQTAYASIPPTSQWSHLAHSMGTLVSREAFESGSPAPYTENKVAFAAGPHLGSPVINVLQSNLGWFDRFVRYLVVNEIMDFTNADGTPCQVDIQDDGFTDLAVGSAALNLLNTGAADRHPDETYHTFGGNDRGLKYDLADALLGVWPDDGLVFLSSANPGELIGADSSAVLPESHTTIVTDTVDSLPEILKVLGWPGI